MAWRGCRQQLLVETKPWPSSRCSHCWISSAWPAPRRAAQRGSVPVALCWSRPVCSTGAGLPPIGPSHGPCRIAIHRSVSRRTASSSSTAPCGPPPAWTWRWAWWKRLGYGGSALGGASAGHAAIPLWRPDLAFRTADPDAQIGSDSDRARIRPAAPGPPPEC